MRYTEQEKLFLKAKAEYYKGTPIMSDAEFDILENKLNLQVSSVTEMVGFQDDDRNAKFKHPSPMLSLSKYQADGYENHLEFLGVVNKWFYSLPFNIWYEATGKFDGNAVNLIYKRGNLVAGLTRSTGTHGRDITKKCVGNYTIPQTINCDSDIVEIRCEIVFPIDKFKSINERRGDLGLEPFANERNFVAGILNNDEAAVYEVDNLVFFAIAGKEHNNNKIEHLSFTEMNDLGFNEKHPLYRPTFKTNTFSDVYDEMVKYREKSNFRLDGFVISVMDKDIKTTLGENSHDPNWAKAIKFPADVKETVIEGIEWSLARDGEMVPVALLTPTLLDGSVVRRANMANLGLVESNEYYTGATVLLRKAGDIIPQIVKLVEPTEKEIEIPTNCPSCESKLLTEGIHLMCRNPLCESQLLRKFTHAVGVLDIFGLGDAQISNIYDAGITDAFTLFNANLFNKENLIEYGQFKAGRALDKIFIEFEKIKEVSIINIFRMLGIENLGRSISLQLAREYSGLEPDYTSLDRGVVQLGKEYFGKVNDIVEYLNFHVIKVIMVTPDEEPSNGGSGHKVEFTGSPKSFGYKTKKEYLEECNKLGNVKHVKLNDADYLIADSTDGTSSKIKAANKKGIEVITYSQFIEQIS